MCGEHHPNTLQTEAHKTRTSVIFSQQQQTQQTHDTTTQVFTQEQQTTQTAAPPAAALLQTAQEQTTRSSCARRNAERAFRKNQEQAAQRAARYESSEHPGLLLEEYLAGQEEKLGEVELEQEGDAELQMLKKKGLMLEYEAMKKVKDPAAAREFYQKLRYFQDCTDLAQSSILRASVRRNILMPRLQAEGKLNEKELAAICSQHQKALGTLTTLSGLLDELHNSLGSLLPAGQQIEDVSDDDLAQYESQISARAMKQAERPTKEKPQVPLIGLQRARAQIFAERNTALPKTLVNYGLRKKGFEQPNAAVQTQNRANMVPLATESGAYSQADYNQFHQDDRKKALETLMDVVIKNLNKRIDSISDPVRKQMQIDRQTDLMKNRDKISGMSREEAEGHIVSYLKELSANCAWSRRLPARVVEQILDSEDHRIKTQFETNRSEAALDFASREQMATRDFGTDVSSLESHEHENYGYLSDKDLEREAACDTMDAYGSVMVSFKRQMLADRTTLTLGDSLVTLQAGCIPCFAENPDLSVVDRYHYPLILSAALTYQDRKQQDPNADIFRELTMMGIDGLSYGELQFHGDLKIDDQYVEQVMILRRSYPANAEKQQEENERVERIAAKLHAAGIKNVEIRNKTVSGKAADV